MICQVTGGGADVGTRMPEAACGGDVVAFKAGEAAEVASAAGEAPAEAKLQSVLQQMESMLQQCTCPITLVSAK